MDLGALTQLMARTGNPPLIMFDKIKGDTPGDRVATKLYDTHRRVALGLGLPLEARELELVQALRAAQQVGRTPIPPVAVETGPIKENVYTGDDVNVFAFPAPKWNELDGGRYIGTGTMTVMRDPDTGIIKPGAYRSMLQERNVISLNIPVGNHADLLKRKS